MAAVAESPQNRLWPGKKPLLYSNMIHEVYQTTVTEFIKDKNGNVCQAKLTKLKSEKIQRQDV